MTRVSHQLMTITKMQHLLSTQMQLPLKSLNQKLTKEMKNLLEVKSNRRRKSLSAVKVLNQRNQVKNLNQTQAKKRKNFSAVKYLI